MLAAGFAHPGDGGLQHCLVEKWLCAPAVVVVSNTEYIDLKGF
jgi:hypothetical protein